MPCVIQIRKKPLDGHRHDLVLETAFGPGLFGALVAFQRQRILVFTRDVEVLGHVLGRHTHVDRLERIVQGTDHHVDHLGITHAGTPAGRQGRIRGTAHVLGTTTDGHIAIAQQDGLAGRHDRLQAGTAQTVDVIGRRLDRYLCSVCRLLRCVLCESTESTSFNPTRLPQSI